MISTLILRHLLAFSHFEGNHQTENSTEHKISFMFLHNLWRKLFFILLLRYIWWAIFNVTCRSLCRSSCQASNNLA